MSLCLFSNRQKTPIHPKHVALSGGSEPPGPPPAMRGLKISPAFQRLQLTPPSPISKLTHIFTLLTFQRLEINTYTSHCVTQIQTQDLKPSHPQRRPTTLIQPLLPEYITIKSPPWQPHHRPQPQPQPCHPQPYQKPQEQPKPQNQQQHQPPKQPQQQNQRQNLHQQTPSTRSSR